MLIYWIYQRNTQKKHERVHLLINRCHIQSIKRTKPDMIIKEYSIYKQYIDHIYRHQRHSICQFHHTIISKLIFSANLFYLLFIYTPFVVSLHFFSFFHRNHEKNQKKKNLHLSFSIRSILVTDYLNH